MKPCMCTGLNRDQLCWQKLNSCNVMPLSVLTWNDTKNVHVVEVTARLVNLGILPNDL